MTDDDSMIFDTEHPIFGNTVFLSNNEYGGLGGGKNVFNIDIDEKNIIEARSMPYQDNWMEGESKKIMEHFAKSNNLDIETVQGLVAEEIDTFDVIPDGEFGWEVQSLTSQVGKAMGFDAVLGTDENGAVWMMEGSKAINSKFYKVNNFKEKTS